MRDRYICLVFFLTTLTFAVADNAKCMAAKGSCITYGYNGTAAQCTLNGAYIERTSCYYNVCRNGYFNSQYTCRYGCKEDQTCIQGLGNSYRSWKDARAYCRRYTYDLLDVDTEDIANSLFSGCSSRWYSYARPVYVGGSSSSKSAPFKWTNGNLVDASIASQVHDERQKIVGAACLTVTRDTSTGSSFTWGVSACSQRQYGGFCGPTCKPMLCRYNGKSYNIGEVVWKSPTCECTRMICQADGEVHLVQKEKPCCIYHDQPYGNNEVVVTEDCYQILCHKGELASVPHCPEGFTVIQYNGVASCYHVSKDIYNYQNASNYCENKRSNLAVVSSEGENLALEDHLFYSQLHGGCKNGWLGAAVGYTSYATQGTPDFSSYLDWQSGMLLGMPVASIYDDFCEMSTNCSSNVDDVYLGISYTGSQETNNYCWNCPHGYELKNAICERCITCEHRYSEVCLYCGKIYDNGEVIKQETEIAPCYEKVCDHGKVQQKSIKCSGSPGGDVPK